MTSDIFDAIDAAIGCQKCGRDLGGSPSSDFCGSVCQTAWHAARAKPLTNYREAGHDFVDDAVRFNRPEETTPAGRIQGFSTGPAIIDETHHLALADLRFPDGTIQRIYTDTLRHQDWGTVTFDGRGLQVTFDRPYDPPAPEPLLTRDEEWARAVAARRNRNTGPVSRPRAPRTINARGHR